MDDKCKRATCPNLGSPIYDGYCSETHRAANTAQELAALRTEFDAYKARVRQEAIDASVAEGWCESGLNAALQRLGLEPHHPVRDYSVSVTFTATRRGTVNITAPDEDEAFEMVGEMSVQDAHQAAFGRPVSGAWAYTFEADQVDEQ